MHRGTTGITWKSFRLAGNASERSRENECLSRFFEGSAEKERARIRLADIYSKKQSKVEMRKITIGFFVFLPLFFLLSATKGTLNNAAKVDPIEAKIQALDSSTITAASELDGLYYNNLTKLYVAAYYLDSLKNQNEKIKPETVVEQK